MSAILPFHRLPVAPFPRPSTTPLGAGLCPGPVSPGAAANVAGMTTNHVPQTTRATNSRLDFRGIVPGFSRAMTQLQRASTAEVAEAGIEPQLHELVKIRASQLNGCAYCIDMHTKDARALGETEQRLYALPAWRETPFFTPRERAALAFAESVTLLASTHVPDADYEAVAAQFSDREIAALITAIVTINAWNRIVATSRSYEVGSYQPPTHP